MKPEVERNLGPQPLAQLLSQLGLQPRDLVRGSAEPLTFKMIARACHGRRLTPRTQAKVLAALNRTTGKQYSLEDLFNYH